MKYFNKTLFTSALLATFLIGQPALADSPDHNEAAPSNVSMSHDMHHAKKDAIFGDEQNHNNYSAGHSAGDESHGSSIPTFTSAEHQAIKKLIFGDVSKSK